MELRERMGTNIGKLVGGGLLLGLVGCATPNLLPGEKLTRVEMHFCDSTGEIIADQDITYTTTDEARRRLSAVAGIRDGTVNVRKGYGGKIHVSGTAPHALSRSFYEAFKDADTDDNGVVDTPEARELYWKTVEEKASQPSI